MSKEFKNIDELFKAELGGSTAKAPAHVKANIDKAIGFGGRKKLLWFLLPIVVIGIATPLLYNHFNTETENDLAISDSIESQNPSSPANDNGLSSSSDQTTDNTINDASIENGSDIIENNSTYDYQSTNDNLTYSDKNLNSTSDKVSNVNSQKSNLKKSDLKDKEPLKDDKSIITNTKKDPIGAKAIDKKVTANDKLTDAIDTSLIEKDDLADLKKSNSDSLTKPKVEIADNTITPSDSLADVNPTIDLTDTEIDSTLEKADITIDEPSEQYNPWILTATAGINLKKSNLTIPTTGDSMSSFHNLNDKIGHSAQVEIAYRMKNSLTFGIGIGYSSYIENYTYFKEESVLTDTLFTWVYTQDSMQDTNMNWIYWTDSAQNATPVYENQEIYNANGNNINTYLNIPLSIGTNLDFGKFRWDLYAQGRFNLLLRSRTTYIQGDELIVVPKGSFKNRYFDLILGTNLHYNIFGNLYITGTVRYKAPTSKVYYPTLTNRFQNVHVGVGFSLNF